MNTATLQKNLTRRYLIWAYKSTRESFERIERKTTQLVVDQHILNSLHRNKNSTGPDYQKHIDDFSAYIAKKQQEELTQKFTDPKKKDLHPQYLYLKDRLVAIEGAIKDLLGAPELKKIENMYEEEFTKRILEAKDH